METPQYRVFETYKICCENILDNVRQLCLINFHFRILSTENSLSLSLLYELLVLDNGH